MSDPFEFRPVTVDEMSALRRLTAYVFADNEEFETQEAALRPEWTQAAFHRGRLVACSGAYPFKLRMNGRGVLADGVTAVGTDPGYRRRGLVRRLVTDLLHRAHDSGHPVSILFASMGAIYQRFGYGQASAYVSYSFDPKLAAFQFGEPPAGYTRLLDKDEAVPLARALYRDYIDERNLLLHRSPLVWERLFRDPKRKTYCAVHFDAQDNPDGYLFYGTSDHPTQPDLLGQEMSITDFVWRDINGYRGLWEYVRGHDLVGRVVTKLTAPDDPAPAMLIEPRVLNRRTGDGIWLRVVDVADALAGRGYQHAGETLIQIEADAECPWNVGTFRLTTDGVQAEAHRVEAEAEVRITQQGLASLLSGQCKVSQLARMGRAAADVSAARLAALDALFSTRFAPYCMDEF